MDSGLVGILARFAHCVRQSGRSAYGLTNLAKIEKRILSLTDGNDIKRGHTLIQDSYPRAQHLKKFPA